MLIRTFISHCAPGAVALLFGVLAPAHAQSAALTLEEAMTRAMAENPSLRGSEYLLQASRSREARANLKPPLAIGGDLEDFAGTDTLSGVDSLQTTLRLSGVLELGDKRLARVAVAERETDIVAIEQETRRLDLLAQVATRFAEVAARQEQLEVTRESSRLAAITVERVAERIRIGAAPKYELGRAEVRLARARIDEGNAGNELASARVRLAATWGAMAADFERVSANLFELPQAKPLAQFMADIDSSPAIRLMLSRERLADAQLNLASSARGFDIAWSAGVRRVRAIDDTALVASVTVPLGARRRAEPAMQEARALRALAPLELQAARIEANAALFGLYRELEQARLETQTLRDQVQPQTESVLQSTELAFRSGRTSFLEYANAQQQLLEVRRDAVVAAAGYHALLIEIERLTGASLGTDDANRGEEQ
ncbi:MAG: TolC family protein [Steroidobacteraceae bacterium]